MSLKPIGWEDKIKKEVADKVLWQYRSIKQKIESEISDKDTLTVNYEEICRNPKQFLKMYKYSLLSIILIQTGMNGTFKHLLLSDWNLN